MSSKHIAATLVALALAAPAAAADEWLLIGTNQNETQFFIKPGSFAPTYISRNGEQVRAFEAVVQTVSKEKSAPILFEYATVTETDCHAGAGTKFSYSVRDKTRLQFTNDFVVGARTAASAIAAVLCYWGIPK